MAAKKCIVRNCVAPSRDFAVLPTDSDRRKLWLKILEREDVYTLKKRQFVCYNHFRDEMIGPSGKRLTGTAIPFLSKEYAIPINSWSSSLLHQQSDEEDGNQEQELNSANVANKAVRTDQWLLEEKTTYLRYQIVDLKKQLKSERTARLQLEKWLHSKEHLVNLANKYLSQEMACLVENMVSNSERPKQRQLYNGTTKEI